MGNKKLYYNENDEMFNQSRNEEVAERLENYVNGINDLCIMDGKNVNEINESIKIIKKACKNLRHGHPEKVYDEERFYEYINNCNNEY